MTQFAKPTRPAPRRTARRRVLLFHMDHYDAATHRGAVEWCRDHDWALDAPYRSRQLPPVSKVDGIVFNISQPKTLAWLRQFGCPMVRMHSSMLYELLEATRDMPAVQFDFESVGRLGAEHLLGLGRPHFVYYQRGETEDTLRMRDSFLATIRAAGHEPSIFNFAADHPVRDPHRVTSLEARIDWLAGRIRRTPVPMAIMTEDDRFAPDLVEAARKVGLSVPEDVAVLGTDDNFVASGSSPVPISSVDSNAFGVGYTAARIIGDIVAGKTHAPGPVHVPARRVVARRSTATYAGAHPGINRALQHVRQNFRSPLRMETLARLAGLSPRGFQHAFKQEVGRTLQDEMTRLRIGAATELLETTDLKLDAVASESNLGDAKNLCRVFAKAHGISPNEWRRRHHTGR